MFLLLFHCFLITQTEIELQPNINLIKINKKTENSQKVLNKRRERTLRIRMDHVVKVDEMKRQTDSRLKWKTENRREIVESIKC